MSTTRPPRKPSPARKARSARLPSAPPRMMPNPSAQPRCSARTPITTSTATSAQPTSAIAVVLPNPRENAARSLNTRLSRSEPTRSIGTVGQRRQRPLLGQLVEDDDDGGGAEEGAQVAPRRGHRVL